MTRPSSIRPQRWGGSVTVLAALLAVPLVGMLAFSIDIGYIAKVQEECQNAADSGSLAGVSHLDSYAGFSNVGTSNATDKTLRQNLLQTAVNAAKAEAKRFITTNTAGGVTLSIDKSNDDIDVGYWDPVAKTFTVTSISPPDRNWPNAVRTTIRRDDSNLPYSNGALPLFFARVFGVKTVNVQEPAVSIRHVTIAPPTITGLGGNSYNAGNGGLMPFAVDVDAWNYYLLHGNAGPGDTTVDNYSAPTIATPPGSSLPVSGSDGIPEFQVYPPTSLIHPSQKGLLSFDPSKFSGNGNTISSWINPGPSGLELVDNFGSNGFQTPVDLYGTPGNKTGHFSDLTGQIRLQPLIDYPHSTTGNHGQYHVVGMALVLVVYGLDNSGIWVQPYSGPIPTAMTGGTAVSSSYTYTDSVTENSSAVPAFDPNLLPSGYHSYVLSQ